MDIPTFKAVLLIQIALHSLLPFTGELLIFCFLNHTNKLAGKHSKQNKSSYCSLLYFGLLDLKSAVHRLYGNRIFLDALEGV